MSDHAALDPIHARLDAKPDEVQALMDSVGLIRASHREGGFRQLAAGKGLNEFAFGVAVVACAYQRARRHVTADVRSPAVSKILNEIKARPQLAMSTLRGNLSAKCKRLNEVDPAAAELARLMLEEAALTLLVERSFRLVKNRGSMIPPKTEKLGKSDLRDALMARRGQNIAVSRNVGGSGVPLAKAVGDALAERFPAESRMVQGLAAMVDTELFRPTMAPLLREAARRAHRDLPEGRVHLYSPASYALAWGAIELLVGFAPENIDLAVASTEGGPLEAVVNGIHNKILDPEKSKNTAAADGIKAAVSVWARGRPALMFCDEANSQRELARVESVQRGLD